MKSNAKLLPEDLSVITTYREDYHREIISFLNNPGSGAQNLEKPDIFYPDAQTELDNSDSTIANETFDFDKEQRSRDS